MPIYLSKEGKGQKRLINNVLASDKQTLKLRNGGGSVGNMYCILVSGE